MEPLGKNDFFNAFWNELERHKISYAVLHSWQNYPEQISSDVDYAVRDTKIREIVPLLSKFSRAHGWRLVQVIEHEPKAFYCVCIQKGGDFEQLDLDVTANYARLGHRLIPNKYLLEGHRKISGKEFYVTSVSSEFCYLLAKASAKQKKYSDISHRILELLDEDLEGCWHRFITIFNLGDKVVPETREEAASQVADLFVTERCFTKLKKRKWGVSEVLLYARRIIQPTGFCLRFKSSDWLESKSVVLGIIKSIEALYRRVIYIEKPSDLGRLASGKMLIKTSLLVDVSSDNPKITKLHDSSLTIDELNSDSKSRIIEVLAQKLEERHKITT